MTHLTSTVTYITGACCAQFSVRWRVCQCNQWYFQKGHYKTRNGMEERELRVHELQIVNIKAVFAAEKFNNRKKILNIAINITQQTQL